MAVAARTLRTAAFGPQGLIAGEYQADRKVRFPPPLRFPNGGCLAEDLASAPLKALAHLLQPEPSTGNGLSSSCLCLCRKLQGLTDLVSMKVSVALEHSDCFLFVLGAAPVCLRSIQMGVCRRFLLLRPAFLFLFCLFLLRRIQHRRHMGALSPSSSHSAAAFCPHRDPVVHGYFHLIPLPAQDRRAVFIFVHRQLPDPAILQKLPALFPGILWE